PPASSVEVPLSTLSTPWNEPRLSAEEERIAGPEFDRPGRIVAAPSPDPEQASVSEREREHGGGKVLLVAVLVQPHPGVRCIGIDEARLRGVRVTGKLLPGAE